MNKTCTYLNICKHFYLQRCSGFPYTTLLIYIINGIHHYDPDNVGYDIDTVMTDP